MSLLFVASSSQYAEIGSAIKSGTGWTFACWVKRVSTTGTQGIFSIATASSGNNYYRLDVATADLVRFRARTTGSSDALTTGIVGNTNWRFICCRSTSITSRSVWLDTEKINSTTSRDPSGMTRTNLGCSGESSRTNFADMRIAVPCIWNVALSDADIDSLAAGAHPLAIQNADILSYWPLGSVATENDTVASNHWTFTGATYDSDEPSIDAAPSASYTANIPLVDIQLTKFNPSVSTTDNKSVSVPLSDIQLANLNPSVQVTGGVSLGIPLVDIQLAKFNPSISTTDNKSVSIPLVDIQLTKFNPSIAVSDYKSANIPLVDISLQGFNPSISTTDNKSVSIPLSDISLQAFNPSVQVTGGISLNIPLADIQLAKFNPSIVISDHKIISTSTGTVSLSALEPYILINANINPSIGNIEILALAPSVIATDNKIISIPTGTLTLARYAPRISKSAIGIIVELKAEALLNTLLSEENIYIAEAEALLNSLASEENIYTAEADRAINQLSGDY